MLVLRQRKRVSIEAGSVDVVNGATEPPPSPSREGLTSLILRMKDTCTIRESESQ